MLPVEITPVGTDTLPALDQALRQLSADLGDTHCATPSALSAALFGPVPACYGLLAMDAEGETPLAVALYSPVMSTTLGAPGAYVSDLWVSGQARGQALGPQMLAAVADRAEARWGAQFLKLVNYDDNPRARRFYTRLGFQELPGETAMFLSGAPLDCLKGQ